MSHDGRSSVDILVDVIREQSVLSRDAAARLEALEKSIDHHTKDANETNKQLRQFLYEIREKMEAEERRMLERASREHMIIGAARAFFKSSPGQFLMLALAVWVAARLGVLQHLLNAGGMGG